MKVKTINGKTYPVIFQREVNLFDCKDEWDHENWDQYSRRYTVSLIMYSLFKYRWIIETSDFIVQGRKLSECVIMAMRKIDNSPIRYERLKDRLKEIDLWEQLQ